MTALSRGPQKLSFNASLTQHSFIWFSFDVNLVFSWFLVNDWIVAITKKSQVIVKRFDLIIIFFFHFLVYVDMGLSSNNPITLTVVTSGSSFSRSFSIKVTQLDCYSLSKGSIYSKIIQVGYFFLLCTYWIRNQIRFQILLLVGFNYSYLECPCKKL